MWSVDGTFCNDCTRRNLSKCVDNCLSADNDIFKAEVAISFNAEAANQSRVDAAAIVKRNQVIFAQHDFLVNVDVFADTSAK
jgi:hypothetical protein